MKRKLLAFVVLCMAWLVPQSVSADDRDRCEVENGNVLPSMIIVRVSDSDSVAPEYLFSNATMDVSDPTSAEKALKSSCSGEFQPMTDSDEGAIPENLSQWFQSEDQMAALPGQNLEWNYYGRYYRNYGRYGFYGYNYYYPYYGRYGFYYNSYRYPYTYRYAYPYGGYRYYYYYYPYYR